jgi:hypothetical protein
LWQRKKFDEAKEVEIELTSVMSVYRVESREGLKELCSVATNSMEEASDQ